MYMVFSFETFTGETSGTLYVYLIKGVAAGIFHSPFISHSERAECMWTETLRQNSEHTMTFSTLGG